MRKETITYTDYNNVTRTEDFFFNLNEAELTALQYGVDGGMKEMLERIVKSNDNKQIMACFHDLIAKVMVRRVLMADVLLRVRS